MFPTFLRRLRALCDETLAAAPATPPVEPPVEPPVKPPVTPPVEPPAPPETPPGSTEPVYHPGMRILHQDDFSGADPISTYIRQDGESGLSIDPTGGVRGTAALKIQWEPNRSGCTDGGHMIEKVWPRPPKELVVQWSVRYSPGFLFDWIGLGRSCHGNAKKLFFLWSGTEDGRWMCICENHRIGTGSDHDQPLFRQTAGPEMTPEQLADGKYHRFTFRITQSSAPTTADGSIAGWIDGIQRWDVRGWASRASGGYSLFKTPTTLNQGSPQRQTEWLDSLALWVP